MVKRLLNYTKINKAVSGIVSLIIVAILCFIDWITGYELSFQFFYFIPLAVFSYNTGFSRPSIFIFSLITAIAWFIADYFSEHVYSSSYLYVWNTMSRLIVFCAFSFFLHSIQKSRAKIEKLNAQLSAKNLIVTDSIKYAKTIQDSVLPSFHNFKKLFPESFIINKPKDIVSGDFFWFNDQGNVSYFAIIDCTGHGVPGSLLSIISYSLIHRTIVDKKLNDTESILRNMHYDLVNVLSGGNEIINDGLEISLVKFDKIKNEISISQTTQGLILVNSTNSVKVFESNGYTIGGLLSKRNGAVYTSQNIAVEKGDWLYLFSDGYIDQFGSAENIKFGIEKLSEEVLKIHQQPSEIQLNSLTKTFNQWKGETKQIDDIMLVGVPLA